MYVGTFYTMKATQLLFLLFCYCYTNFVTSQTSKVTTIHIQDLIIYILPCVVVIEPPQGQSVCEEGTVQFTCVVMFPSGTTPGVAIWGVDGGGDARALPGHSTSNDLNNGRPAPTNVSTVLTITNVNISNNGTGYICQFGFGMDTVFSNTTVLTVLGEYIHTEVCLDMHAIYFKKC